MPTPTLTVTFDLISSSSAITIPGPAFSSQPVSQNRRFVTDHAADGTPYTYELTTTERWTWELMFRDLSLSDKRSLEAFFQEHARGPSARFTFTHTTGISYTGRFAQDQLLWTRNHQQLWDCNVRIETTSEPV